MLYSKGVCTEVQLGGIDIFEPCLGESECPLWVSDGLDGSQLRILFFPYSYGKTLHTDGGVNEGVKGQSFTSKTPWVIPCAL